MRRIIFSRFITVVKFGSVGIINTGIDLAVFTALTALGVSAVPAQVISYSCGVLNSYYMNRSWTFHKNKKAPGQAVRFAAVNLAALAATTVLLMILHAYTSFSLLVCKIAATVFSVGINYIGTRYWAFGNQHRSSQNTLRE
ncbi:GtrA family protein [Paenibacillus sepulcri]|uniref:GtrA family protein n=1 Tax=Paenibacillus sepulcri TaxID=359917 RepID=A0ABS7BYS6_9BACL|nr:GtrA family protein [Paenibacillus sepulcri]